MSKKTVISKESQVLLKLLRIALGTEPRMYFGEVVEPFPEGIDWKEVVRLSYEHKVSALAVDGLEASKYDPYKGLDEKQTEELKAILVPWIKDVENTEWSYCYYVEVLKTLCQIFKDNGLTPIILKGYGLSLNYPRQSHRGAGDIDIYLLDEDGNCAAEKGDEIASTVLGQDMNVPRAKHHSCFEFKGIKVENHYEWICGRGDAESVQRLKDLLSNTAKDEAIQEDGMCYPSPTANGIYLMWHMMRHLYREKVDYRQLCDWYTFIRKYYNQINWSFVENVWKDAGLKKFADATSTIMVQHFGMSKYELPPFKEEKEFAAIILNEGQCRFVGKNSGFSTVLYYYRNRTLFRLTEDRSWGSLLVERIKAHFLRKITINLRWHLIH